jgi:hypothetical protein
MSDPEEVLEIARRHCVCEWEGFCSVCFDRAYAEIASRAAPRDTPEK